MLVMEGGRISQCNRVRGHVLIDESAGSNHTVISDADIAYDNGIGSYANVVPYFGGTSFGLPPSRRRVPNNGTLRDIEVIPHFGSRVDDDGAEVRNAEASPY